MYKLTFPIALVAALFALPASAVAQDSAEDIILDFIEDTGRLFRDVADDLEDISEDLVRANEDFVECAGRADGPTGSMLCIKDYRRDTEDAYEDVGRVCNEFLEDYADALEEALEEAIDARVLQEFLSSGVVGDSLVTAMRIIILCNQILE